MKVLAHLRQIAHCGDQPIAHVPRMRAGEPDALHARHLVHRFEQPREVARGIVRRLVVVDDLPEQLHLASARRCCFPRLGENLGLRPHPFVPTRVRHDAEAAVLVAPFDDCHPCPHGIVASRKRKRERHVVYAPRSIRISPEAAGLFDEHGQHPHPACADDDVDGAGAPQQPRALLLRHASRNGDERPVARLPLEVAELAQTRIELLLGALPHAAGVDDDDVGLQSSTVRLVTGRLEQPRHLLGIVEVHLAAERLDSIFPRSLSPFRLAGFAFAFCLPLRFRLPMPEQIAARIRRTAGVMAVPGHHARQLLASRSARAGARPRDRPPVAHDLARPGNASAPAAAIWGDA